MHKKFEINQTKIKGGCLLGRKVVPHGSKSDLRLTSEILSIYARSLKRKIILNEKLSFLANAQKFRASKCPQFWVNVNHIKSANKLN